MTNREAIEYIERECKTCKGIGRSHIRTSTGLGNIAHIEH